MAPAVKQDAAHDVEWIAADNTALQVLRRERENLTDYRAGILKSIEQSESYLDGQRAKVTEIDTRLADLGALLTVLESKTR